ncbi:hypothetical protein [Sorangium sp. So ce1151]|uniref:hypothetical protein n=1 Tax=Sorangium sp. So ce1151 TaxID=3133332 RepID=UPI003F624998
MKEQLDTARTTAIDEAMTELTAVDAEQDGVDLRARRTRSSNESAQVETSLEHSQLHHPNPASVRDSPHCPCVRRFVQ